MDTHVCLGGLLQGAGGRGLGRERGGEGPRKGVWCGAVHGETGDLESVPWPGRTTPARVKCNVKSERGKLAPCPEAPQALLLMKQINNLRRAAGSLPYCSRGRRWRTGPGHQTGDGSFK